MSKLEITRIACKILGVYLIIQGLNVFANVISSYILMQDQSTVMLFVSVVFPFSFLIIFGISIWVFSGKLSSLIVKGEVYSKEESGLKANDLQRVAFSILGLLFIGTSLPELVSNLMNLITMDEIYSASIRLLPGILGNIVQLIIGLVIFFGARGLVNLLENLRHAGLSGEEKRWEKE